MNARTSSAAQSALEDYIMNEFKDTQTEFAARNIKYSFNRTVSNKGVLNDIITMNIKIYDDNMNLLNSKAIKFINKGFAQGSESYKLAKPCEKKLVNIDVNELNNLFTKALDDIKNEIAKEYNAKINEFKAKLECLRSRNGLSDLRLVEPKRSGSESRSENVSNEVPRTTDKNKVKFDM